MHASSTLTPDQKRWLEWKTMQHIAMQKALSGNQGLGQSASPASEAGECSECFDDGKPVAP